MAFDDRTANLKEGWYVPGIHPFITWFMTSFVLLPIWLVVFIIPNWLLWLISLIPGLQGLPTYGNAAPARCRSCFSLLAIEHVNVRYWVESSDSESLRCASMPVIGL